jgi:pimeloyl-ACP methyl ester carboxylesterase
VDIDTLVAFDAGDTTEWIRVRGADAANPVLLLIQQGPGLPMINEARRFARVLGLEQAFTVVYWDQRGCGRSRPGRKDRADISLERMVGDTVSLLEFLRDRFDREIYVAGFSLGATVGAYVAAQRPFRRRSWMAQRWWSRPPMMKQSMKRCHAPRVSGASDAQPGSWRRSARPRTSA